MTPTENKLLSPTDSWIPHAALWILQPLFLMSGPFTGRKHLFLAAVSACAYQAMAHPRYSNNMQLVQFGSISWSYWAATAEKVISSGNAEVEGEFWRTGKPVGEALTYRPFSLKKTLWGLDLMLNQRLIGFNHQVRNVPDIRHSNRWRFAARGAFEMVRNIIMLDLCSQLWLRWFYGSTDGKEIGSLDGVRLTLEHPVWWMAVLRCALFGALPYYMLSLQYAQFSTIAVAIGLTETKYWPPMFGPISEATTIRAFWGKYWHQLVRRVLGKVGSGVVDSLNVRHGTNLSSYLQIWVAFTVSGCFHALSNNMFPTPADVSVKECSWGIFYFFLCQAAAITIEDTAQWAWRKLTRGDMEGRSYIRRLVGYAWVVIALRLSLPLIGDSMLRMRLAAEPMLPFTLWGPIVDRTYEYLGAA